MIDLDKIEELLTRFEAEPAFTQGNKVKQDVQKQIKDALIQEIKAGNIGQVKKFFEYIKKRETTSKYPDYKFDYVYPNFIKDGIDALIEKSDFTSLKKLCSFVLNSNNEEFIETLKKEIKKHTLEIQLAADAAKYRKLELSLSDFKPLNGSISLDHDIVHLEDLNLTLAFSKANGTLYVSSPHKTSDNSIGTKVISFSALLGDVSKNSLKETYQNQKKLIYAFKALSEGKRPNHSKVLISDVDNIVKAAKRYCTQDILSKVKDERQPSFADFRDLQTYRLL
ncbi:MAG: hypothetical protein R3D88_08160 [Alphaproteobacteria bacterium]